MYFIIFATILEKFIIFKNRAHPPCSAPILGKPEFVKNSGRYHKMVLGHHKGVPKLHPTQVFFRLSSHQFWIKDHFKFCSNSTER